MKYFGIGLTDVAKGNFGMDHGLSATDFDPNRLRDKIESVSPRVLAFNGKKAAAIALKVPRSKVNKISYGRQADSLGRAAVYICPQTSRANGHWSRDPWEELARAIKELRTSRTVNS